MGSAMPIAGKKTWGLIFITLAFAAFLLWMGATSLAASTASVSAANPSSACTPLKKSAKRKGKKTRSSKKRHVCPPSTTAPDTGSTGSPGSSGSTGTGPGTTTTPPPPSGGLAGTKLLRPNGDISPQWTVCCTVTSASDALNDNVTQAQGQIPVEDYLYAHNQNQVTEVALSSVTLGATTPSAGKAWFYMDTGPGQSVRTDVIWGGAVRATTTVPGDSDYAWRPISVVPPDQTSVDDLRIRFTVNTAGSGSADLFASYFELTTSGGSTPPPPPPPTHRTLTVTPPTGSGAGTITGSGISCPGDCSQTYADGTAVTLSPSPAAGSTFAGWSGACSGTGSCQLTMNADKAVSGSFSASALPPPPSQYTLTTAVSGSGAISGTGIDCPGDCSEPYNSGTAVTLTGAATAGNNFTGWGGSCSGTASTCTVTMSSAKSVTASFATNNPSSPPFLQGLTKRWSDDASRSNPVESGRWDLYSCQRKDGQQSSSTSVNDLQPGRFSQLSSGGPGNKPYYRFNAPQGDNVWTPGSAGRCELSYPVGDPGNAPAHTGPPGAYFFYEGRRAVTMFSVRLPSSWNVNAPSWRVISQWKQNEWVDTGGVSPALALEQRSGNWIMTSFGGPTIWSQPATGAWGTGNWINLAFDITYSANSSVGKVKVYADTNGDGTYEYASSTWTGQTLFPKNGTGVESVFINGLYEGVGGDSIDKGEASIWN
jgi:Polysaccharide lyase/Divergent InlB B-repeat domain